MVIDQGVQALTLVIEGPLLGILNGPDPLGLELGALVGQEPFLLGLGTSPGDDVLDYSSPFRAADH
mgnify:CR=1 FL=1